MPFTIADDDNHHHHLLSYRSPVDAALEKRQTRRCRALPSPSIQLPYREVQINVYGHRPEHDQLVPRTENEMPSSPDQDRFALQLGWG
jgi:hypothetical protein